MSNWTESYMVSISGDGVETPLTPHTYKREAVAYPPFNRELLRGPHANGRDVLDAGPMGLKQAHVMLTCTLFATDVERRHVNFLKPVLAEKGAA